MGNILTSNETVSNPFKYAGEVYDSETGLYYLMARHNDPLIGRFLNEDTYEGQVNNPLTLNVYTYCTNNPVAYVDPTGHEHIVTQTTYTYRTPTYKKGYVPGNDLVKNYKYWTGYKEIKGTLNKHEFTNLNLTVYELPDSPGSFSTTKAGTIEGDNNSAIYQVVNWSTLGMDNKRTTKLTGLTNVDSLYGYYAIGDWWSLGLSVAADGLTLVGIGAEPTFLQES